MKRTGNHSGVKAFCSRQSAIGHAAGAACLLALVWSGAAFAATFTPPPLPEIRPVISDYYAEDADGSRVADALEDRMWAAETASKSASGLVLRAVAAMALEGMADVELVFRDQVTQEQIDTFVALGGEITYMYRSLSYGWNGRIPLKDVTAVPMFMGGNLALVQEEKPTILHMDTATRTGRVRPVWVSGFAGSASGFDGDATITVAILDTGVDGTHTDLTGRQQYWKDFTGEGNAAPVDLGGHGSHVSGIALGTGASSGAAAGTLYTTDTGDLTSVTSGSFYPAPLDLPSESILYSSTAAWLGGGSTSLYQLYHAKGTSGGWTTVSAATAGVSPVSESNTLTGSSGNAYSPGLLSNGGTVTQYAITSTIPNYPSVNDGFNRLRGVAPACKWAGGKVFTNAGAGSSAYIDAALDDMVTNRVANNIKVINMSLGINGGPGLSTTTRQKTNTAVANGIVVCCSAGNDGTGSTAAARQVDDPGRAAMAITVAASSDVNAVTGYSSEGFPAPGSTAGQEEDYKPDLVAPGGSLAYQTSILSVDSNGNDGASLADQRANDYTSMQGTSMASPFAAGCAALVIDAMQQAGTSWSFASSQHPRQVKMVLCATATETNANREGAVQNPLLTRAAAPGDGSGFPAAKDMYEGYGMLNPDAAIEAVATTYTQGGTPSGILGMNAADARAWAGKVNLYAGWAFNPSLSVPALADFDLYLYSNTPSAYGTPVILASSTNAGNGVAEAINYTPASNMTAILVVKRVSGSGTFGVTSTGDSTGPTAVISAPSSTIAGTGSVTYTVTYADAASGVGSVSLVPANITLNRTLTANGSIGVSGTGNTRTVTISGITGNGTLGISIAAGTAADNMGNSASAAGPSSTFTVDTVAPTCTVTGPTSPTNGSPITFTINFSESVTGLSTAGITVTNGSKGSLTGSGSGPYTLPVTPSGQGSVTCQVTAAAAHDTANNSNTASNNLSVTYDSAAPTCTVTGPASPTNGSPISFTINFAESVSGLSAAGITVTNGSKGSLTGSGSGPYTLPVTPSGQGSVTCQVTAAAAQDAAGNGNTASNNLSITYDSAAPTCTVTGPASPTNGSPITFTINFSESVTGLSTAGITVTNGTKGSLTGSGSGPYTLPVTPSGQGAVTCQVTAAAAHDTANNSNTASNNLSITYDSAAPTCTVTGPASPTNGSPISFTINFGESVSGLSAAGITVTNGSKGSLTGSGSGPYTLPVTPSGQGVVTCQVTAAAAQDAAGNGNTVSNNLSITYDSAAPTCTVTGPTSPTNGSPITFTINFSESVTGLTNAGITVTNASVGVLTGAGSGPYALPVTPSSQGEVTCQVTAAAVQDSAGNGNAASNILNVVYDSLPPSGTVAINNGDAHTAMSAVTLSLSAQDGTGTGVVQMRFSDDDAVWSDWETLAPTKAWTLSADDGVKAVFAEYKDAAGNVSAGIINDTITYDTTVPVISLLGSNPETVECGGIYGDAGATATDNLAGDVTSSIVVDSPVNAAAVGVYTVRYNVSDGNGQDAAEVTRTVNVVDTTAPDIVQCAAGQSVVADSLCQAVVPDFAAMVIASDTCGQVHVVQSPDAGTVVGPGETAITLTVSDDANNASICNSVFTVDNPASALVPSAPVVGNLGANTLDVTLQADGNAATVEYALYCGTLGKWVQANGALASLPVWRTMSAWGTVTVTGLNEYTAYAFAALARNCHGAETGPGPAASATTKDVTAPTGTVIINNNQSVINTLNVTLALTWDDGSGSGVVRMRFSDDGMTWSAWEPLQATRTHTLPGGDGYHTLRVQFRDRAGNNSVVFSDYVRVDTVAPSGTIIINNGALTTTTQSVTLSLTWADNVGGSGVVRMRFSDDGAHWTVWEVLKATRAYTLPAGTGYHTVRAQYRDAGGNISAATNDYIKLLQ